MVEKIDTSKVIHTNRQREIKFKQPEVIEKMMEQAKAAYDKLSTKAVREELFSSNKKQT